MGAPGNLNRVFGWALLQVDKNFILLLYGRMLTGIQGVDLRLGNLAFSGCMLFMGAISQNLIRRAQTDDGTCSQMLNDKCINALQNQLEEIAF